MLAHVYKAAPSLNIVFAEAITVDSGSRHDTRLILESFHPDFGEDVAETVAEQIQKLKMSLATLGFSDPLHKHMHPTEDDLTWMDIGSITYGWTHVEGWRAAVESQAREDPHTAEMYDLDTAVISADTELRMLRYVFPRRGAVSVSVKHSDRPGAMGEIAEALAGRDLNILSSLLRRGSARAQKTEAVVVVEPPMRRLTLARWRRAREALAALPKTLRVNVKVSGPVDPEHAVLYPRRPHEIAVRPSIALTGQILAVQHELARSRLASARSSSPGGSSTLTRKRIATWSKSFGRCLMSMAT